MFMMRFDMRAPEFGGSTTDLYKAAIDMAEWAETRGCIAAVISEHHTSSDGYIPSPLLLASAMAARTDKLYISIAAALLAFYDPIRLAEDMAVLDIISNGRLSYTLGLGYRPEEFEMYGIDWKQRGAVVEEKLQLLLKAKTGEPFEHEGRRIHVTPAADHPRRPDGDVGRRFDRRREARRSLRARLLRPEQQGRACSRPTRRRAASTGTSRA